jgi:hypothetical protein
MAGAFIDGRFTITMGYFAVSTPKINTLPIKFP